MVWSHSRTRFILADQIVAIGLDLDDVKHPPRPLLSTPMVCQLRQGVAVCEYRIANLCNAERDFRRCCGMDHRPDAIPNCRLTSQNKTGTQCSGRALHEWAACGIRRSGSCRPHCACWTRT